MILDLAALQTLVVAVDLDGFGRAAERLHRSPAAVSLQLKALEEKIGTPLFRKNGRQQALTEAGELLLGFARRLLQLNEETLIAMRGMHLDGEVRFGMPQDFADQGLPDTLARFARAHPAVRIEIKVERSAALRTQLSRGALDLILAYGPATSTPQTPLARLPIRWLGRSDLVLLKHEPVPLLLLDAPCSFREAAIAALDKAGRPWRVALSSGSVSALWAAATAGLGITPRIALSAPENVADIGRALRLPSLGKIALCVEQGTRRNNAAVAQLRVLVEDVVRKQLTI